MATVSETSAMIAAMSPVLRPGRFIFCTTQTPAPEAVAEAIATFAEEEGLSLILPEPAAARHGFSCAQPMAMITLEVFSSLEGVGLTAAVASALAAAGIPCNMVAAFHHDHAFVPATQAGQALAVLQEAQRNALGQREKHPRHP